MLPKLRSGAGYCSTTLARWFSATTFGCESREAGDPWIRRWLLNRRVKLAAPFFCGGHPFVNIPAWRRPLRAFRWAASHVGRYALSVRQLLAAFLGISALACGSGPTDTAAPLTGHFVALNPWVTGPGFALGLSLTVTGSAVTGAGWLGGQDNPLTPLSISGEFTDPSYTLTLSRVPTGDTVAVLVGQTTSSAMQ